MKRIRFRHTDGIGVTESDLIIVSNEIWADMPESASGEWATHSLGGKLLALRLDPSLGSHVDRTSPLESRAGRHILG